MKKLKLKDGLFALIDDEDFERVAELKWHRVKHRGRFYVWHTQTLLKDGKREQRPLGLQRFILGLSHGDGKIVDHIDRDPLNNQKANLRLVSRSQNGMNRRKNKEAILDFKGVGVSRFKDKRHFYARCKKDGISFRSQGFESPQEAAKAYDILAKALHGEFALLNFI